MGPGDEPLVPSTDREEAVLTTHARLPDPADLAALWDLSTEMLSIATTEGRFTHVNGAWERTLGWTPEEFLAMDPLTELVHPDDVEPSVTALEAIARPGGQVTGFENRYRHRDGGYRRLRWFARTDETGTVVYSVTRDVTEQREAEEALARSEELWRLVQQEAAIGLAIVGLDGRWLAVNPALCELTGYREDELLGLTFQDITHPDDLDAGLTATHQLLTGEIPRFRQEKRYVRKDGTSVWALLAVALARTPDGEPDHFIAQIADISTQKRQERELNELVRTMEQANADLERFTALAAHDLRSPLATIGSFLDLAAEEPLTDDARSFLGHARGGIDKLRKRTEALLRFARATARPLDVGQHEVEGLVRDAVARLTALVEERDAVVRWDVEDGACVEVDTETVGSVLQNLLTNALRYVPDGMRPEVSVTARRVDDAVRIVVDDNGPGVPTDERERMFEPFIRGDSRVEGTGLGLATARRLAERNGGSVAFEDAPHDGARVVLRLPAAPDRIVEVPRPRLREDATSR